MDKGLNKGEFSYNLALKGLKIKNMKFLRKYRTYIYILHFKTSGRLNWFAERNSLVICISVFVEISLISEKCVAKSERCLEGIANRLEGNVREVDTISRRYRSEIIYATSHSTTK